MVKTRRGTEYWKQQVAHFMHLYFMEHNHFPRHKEIAKKFKFTVSQSIKIVTMLIEDGTAHVCPTCKKKRVWNQILDLDYVPSVKKDI